MTDCCAGSSSQTRYMYYITLVYYTEFLVAGKKSIKLFNYIREFHLKIQDASGVMQIDIEPHLLITLLPVIPLLLACWCINTLIK